MATEMTSPLLSQEEKWKDAQTRLLSNQSPFPIRITEHPLLLLIRLRHCERKDTGETERQRQRQREREREKERERGNGRNPRFETEESFATFLRDYFFTRTNSILSLSLSFSPLILVENIFTLSSRRECRKMER